MIDFDALVLGPSMMAYARPITVTPLASQPDGAAYEARGVWSSKPVDVSLLDDGIMSSQNHTLGVRISEFDIPIEPGDEVEIDAHMSLPRIGVCRVEDVDEDGQGGAVLTLKVMR